MPEAAPLVWDVALRRALRHGASRFDIDLRFASRAARIVLYGPSGAGKTQTLKMIAGIAQPEAGRIAIAGQVLFDSAAGLALASRDRRLGHVFQDYALFPHLTVRQNIGFASRRGWRNPGRDLVDAEVERWLDAFGLRDLADHLPDHLSGGQRQRTALARALVAGPRALLLDEPFAALDKGLRARLRDELKDLQQALGLPMLLITHDDDDVRVLAEDVVAMHAGRRVDPASAAARLSGA